MPVQEQQVTMHKCCIHGMVLGAINTYGHAPDTLIRLHGSSSFYMVLPKLHAPLDN